MENYIDAQRPVAEAVSQSVVAFNRELQLAIKPPQIPPQIGTIAAKAVQPACYILRRVYGNTGDINIEDFHRLSAPLYVTKEEVMEMNLVQLLERCCDWIVRDDYDNRCRKEAVMEALVEQKREKPVRFTRIAVAIILRVKHPNWTDKKIANEVGIHPSNLCRNVEYKRAKAVNVVEPKRQEKKKRRSLDEDDK